MNASQFSKGNESLTITSNSLRKKIKIDPKLNMNFFPIVTRTGTLPDQPNSENPNYRKTISYLGTSSIVDLMKQSNLAENKFVKVNKTYLINLIKMKIKKDKSKLPTIQAFKTFSPKTDINFKTFSIDFNGNKKNDAINLHKTFNYSNRNHNKEKINELYKKIYDNDKNNLKSVYVNQFINCNKNRVDEKEIPNLNIKPKIVNNINQNLITSQKRFLKYHGFNKRNKYIYRIKLYGKKREKYPNLDSFQILRFFLKKKLKILNNDVSKVKDECDVAKSNLVSAYESFNKEAEKHIEEIYRNEEEF